MKLRSLSVLFIFLLLAVVPVMAYDGYGPDHKLFPLQNQVFSTIHQYWLVQDLFEKLATDHSSQAAADYKKATDIFQKQSVDLGKKVLAQIDEPNRESLTAMSDIYKSLEPLARQSLYPSLATLRNQIAMEFKSPLTDKEFREYFPGYGYTEPGYKYRKGREIERENKGTTWQSEEHSITSTFSVEVTVTLDLLNILKGMVTSGAIKNLESGTPYEVNVNGTPMFVVKVSFTVVKSIVTKTNRKFEVNKIWFELLRSKDSGWGNPGTWEPVGKTYEIINEPTGEEVVTNISQA